MRATPKVAPRAEGESLSVALNRRAGELRVALTERGLRVPPDADIARAAHDAGVLVEVHATGRPVRTAVGRHTFAEYPASELWVPSWAMAAVRYILARDAVLINNSPLASAQRHVREVAGVLLRRLAAPEYETVRTDLAALDVVGSEAAVNAYLAALLA